MEENYVIGGMEVPRNDAEEAICKISPNRTLAALQLTEFEPISPVIVQGLKTIRDAFQHFKPDCEVVHETEDGTEVAELLAFENLGDFGKNGITKQSAYLRGIKNTQEEYLGFQRQLNGNRTLRTILAHPVLRAAYLAAVESLADQLDKR